MSRDYAYVHVLHSAQVSKNNATQQIPVRWNTSLMLNKGEIPEEQLQFTYFTIVSHN